MANKVKPLHQESIGSWTKRCYLAGRAAMEAMLRPYDVGGTQWYVLYHLAKDGPIMQRDLVRILQIERATLSTIVSVLVRKKLVEQVPDSVDQRQKRLRLTAAGIRLWGDLPDLAAIHKIAFGGIDKAAVAAAVEVLKTATERLEQFTERK